ncbi:MAG: GC-type dockerin domain-anchored protein [Phycisphaerales bacterium]
MRPRPYPTIAPASVLCVALLAATGPAVAQPERTHAGGAACEAAATFAWPQAEPRRATDLERMGRYVLASGPGMAVYDASDPARPELIATFEPEGMPTVDRIEVVGGVAWLADDTTLVAVDATDPSSMRELHRFEPGWTITGLASGRGVEGGGILAVTMLDSLLHLYDVGDPTNPIEGVSSGIGGGSLHFAFMGSVLVGVNRDGLTTRWVPDANTYRRLGHVRLPDNAMGLSVAGTTALVPCRNVGLVAFDLRDPANPREAGRRADLVPQAVASLGSLAVVAAFDADEAVIGRPNTIVRVLDARDPDDLTDVRAYITGFASDAVLLGRHAVLAGDRSLLAVDLARPVVDSRLGLVRIEPRPAVLAAHESHAYAARNAVLTVLDVTDPTDPRAIATRQAGARITGLWREDDLLVLATEEGVESWSLAEPAAPAFVSGQALPWPVLDASIDGAVLAIAVPCPQGLILLDIADPASPRVLGPAAFARCPFRLDAEGSLIASAEREGSTVAFTDVSDAIRPRELGEYDAGAVVRDVLLADGLAYVLAGGRVRVLDVTDPAHPVLLGQGEGALDEPGMLVLRDEVLVIETADRVRLVDVGEPARPLELGSLYQTDVRAVAFTADELLVAAGRSAGFVRVHGLSACRPCPGDLDGDGAATVLDYLEFTNRFLAGDPGADYDADGVLTVVDFLAFERAFAAGCD